MVVLFCPHSEGNGEAGLISWSAQLLLTHNQNGFEWRDQGLSLMVDFNPHCSLVKFGNNSLDLYFNNVLVDDYSKHRHLEDTKKVGRKMKDGDVIS